MKNILAVILFISSITFLHAQDTKLLNGKITSNLDDLSGITIKNSTQNYEKVTLQGGYFSLKVSLKDTLIFSSDFLYEYTHVVSEDDFKTDLLQIRMIELSNLLEEVHVYAKFDPVALGILQKPAKQYTVNERRLQTSKSGPVDFIANSLNGKKKQLNKLINMENTERKEQSLLSFFGTSDLISDYHIPSDMLYAFAQYACADSAVKSALQHKNKSLLQFLLIDISLNFIKDYKLTE